LRELPALILPPAKRRDFAWPRGLLCRGGSCAGLVAGFKRIVCVGDVVSALCVRGLQEGILSPELLVLVFDGKTRRKEEVKPIRLDGVKLGYHEVVNPPGGITLDAARLLCGILKGEGVHAVKVVGEEDMLALIAIECSLPGSVVVYGVPGEGMALVTVTPQRRLDAWIRHTELEPGLVKI